MQLERTTPTLPLVRRLCPRKDPAVMALSTTSSTLDSCGKFCMLFKHKVKDLSIEAWFTAGGCMVSPSLFGGNSISCDCSIVPGVDHSVLRVRDGLESAQHLYDLANTRISVTFL